MLLYAVRCTRERILRTRRQATSRTRLGGCFSAADISFELSRKWGVPYPFIPEVTDLGHYLDTPLDLAKKIPISDMLWQGLLQTDINLPDYICTPEDLEMLFVKSTDKNAITLMGRVGEIIFRTPPDPSGTEESFHSFWDRNVLDILAFCMRDLKWIRNSNRGTHSGSFRPDFGILLKQTCLFRGAEKKPSFSGKPPRQELADKTRWVYDPARYVLGM
jgi:hypothetical protein